METALEAIIWSSIFLERYGIWNAYIEILQGKMGFICLRQRRVLEHDSDTVQKKQLVNAATKDNILE